MYRQYGGLREKSSRRDRGGNSHSANNTLHSGVAPMRVFGSAVIPVVFILEECVRPIPVLTPLFQEISPEADRMMLVPTMVGPFFDMTMS